MANNKTLSVGEVSKRSGIAISALHFYESKGLIQSERNASNHRRYARTTLRKVSVIKAAQRAGIPLNEIGVALATIPNKGKVTSYDWVRMSSLWKKDLEDRIKRLTLLKESLTFCIGCGCLSEQYCEMINPDDKLGKKGEGAQLLDPEGAALFKADTTINT